MIKVAVITGAASGIGLAAVKLFARSGWRVVGVDIAPDPDLGKDVRYCRADVSDPEASEGLFTDIREVEKKIDALVCNAAILQCKPLVEMDPEEWDTVIASNLRSVYLSVRNAYPLMKKAGGAIVNISSVHALATSSEMASYAASKGGVVSLTKALAIELAKDNIRVNALLPGAVDTAMLRAGLTRGQLTDDSVDELMKVLASKHLMGRVGTPEEIAQSILFLADEKMSSFITGQTLVVDGGATCRLSTE